VLMCWWIPTSHLAIYKAVHQSSLDGTADAMGGALGSDRE
jgi:hypothetical protein